MILYSRALSGIYMDWRFEARWQKFGIVLSEHCMLDDLSAWYGKYMGVDAVISSLCI